MDRQKLLELINKGRQRLHNVIDEKGLDNPITIQCSQDLDKLINLYIRTGTNNNSLD